MAKDRQRILVIRTGALGDLVFCMQAFHDIRKAHPGADIALLVRPAFADFARAMPWFDRIIIDTHPGYGDIGAWLKLRRAIQDFAPSRVYDLQGKRRQSILYALLGGPWGPEWSGAAPGCALPRPWPPALGMSFPAFVAAQLRAAGVAAAGEPNHDWLNAPIGHLNLPEKFVVFIPGCSPAAPHKRWPPHRYAQAAGALREKGFEVVAIGTKDDAEAIAAIKAEAPFVVDLCGKTNLFELAGVLRRAAGVIGNDTGPVHIAAALGRPVLALFSERSNPVWSKPPGARVALCRQDKLADLSVGDVIGAFETLMQQAESKSR